MTGFPGRGQEWLSHSQQEKSKMGKQETDGLGMKTFAGTEEVRIQFSAQCHHGLVSTREEVLRDSSSLCLTHPQDSVIQI